LGDLLNITASIDRFEKDTAIILFEGIEGVYEIPKKILPVDCKEGDIITLEIVGKRDLTRGKLKKISHLIKRLKDKDGA